MNGIFADTLHWIALADRRDNLNRQARSLSANFSGSQIVTTDEVLVEFLTFFAGRGPKMRRYAHRYVETILSDPAVLVVPQSRDSFEAGLTLYIARQDKEYSFTDCVSMATMRRLRITDVPTHDHHFQQEGFTILLKE